MNAIAKTAGSMSLEAFLAWDGDQDCTRWQLIDGVPTPMAPAGNFHAAIQSELGRLIGNYLVEQNLALAVLSTPGVAVRHAAQSNCRIPDLAVAPLAIAESGYLTEPLLAIELVSPSNASETWNNVWSYASQPTIREILVVHSQSIQADISRRNPDGTWPEGPASAVEGDITLASIGLTIPVRDLYRTTGLR